MGLREATGGAKLYKRTYGSSDDPEPLAALECVSSSEFKSDCSKQPLDRYVKLNEDAEACWDGGLDVVVLGDTVSARLGYCHGKGKYASDEVCVPCECEPCEDAFSNWACENALKRGSCDMDHYAVNCARTCGVCGDGCMGLSRGPVRATPRPTPFVIQRKSRPTAAPTVAPGFVAGTATFEGLNVVEARKQTGVFRKAVATSYARRRL